MKLLDLEQFNQLMGQTPIKPRLKRELRFVASTAHMTADDWQETEVLPITDRTGVKGVLLLAPDDQIVAVPYELSRSTASRQTGRVQPIICDFCRTWQSGSGRAGISFLKDKGSVTFLCCADLACSMHVRGKTSAARTSRAQLREDITDHYRVERLKDRLRQIIADL